MGRIASFFHKQQPVHVDEISDTAGVSAYVQASTITVDGGTKCVDGRYLPDQAEGMIARPGADGGYVMALEAVNRKKGLGLTPEQCFNAVFKAVKKLNGTFYLHTDHTVDPNAKTHNGPASTRSNRGELIGCGHLAKAARRGYSWEYDVRSQDVVDMVTYARSLSDIEAGVEMINLAGNHQERGVLLVHSDKYTVLSANPKLSQMYFIYDIDRDNIFMKKLVAEMNIPGVTLNDMYHEGALQLAATLQNLAIGLPIYDITFVGNQPQVVQKGIVKRETLLQRMHVPVHTPFALRKRFSHILPH